MASKKAVNTKPKKKQEVVEDEDELLEEDDELLDDEDELEEDSDDEDDEDELEEDDDELDDEEEDDEEEDDEDSDDEDDEDELEDEDDDEDLEDDDDDDEEEDDEEEDDEDSDDEDDEDELEEEDEDDEDEDEDDEEEEEPAPKKSSKKAPAKASKKAATKETKKAPAKASKKADKKKVAPAAKGFDEFWAEVEEKVEANNGGTIEYVDGVKRIPQSPVVSNELLYNLIATDNESNAIKDFIEKMTGKIDKEIASDVKDNRDAYNVTGNDIAPVVQSILDTMYKILKAGSGFKMYNSEECKATLKGEYTEKGTIFDCTKLNTSEGRDYSMVVKDFVKIKVNSPAPSDAKVLGTMNGKKFVEWKESAKSSKKAPAKATSKETKKAPAKKTSKKK